jgi:uncharacterized repeat protein (TIGR04042 family)
MPELSFRLRWPDASETVNYSPSTIIKNYFNQGTSYEISDFLERARRALHAASARVEQTYGHPCARAQHSLASIEQHAAQFTEQQIVKVIEITP